MRVSQQKFIHLFTVVAIILGSTFYVGHSSFAETKDRYLNLQLFAKIMNLVQKYYVDEVDTKKLIYGGIKGMLHELDPHTNFLPPDIYKEFEDETSGRFGGLGIEITVQEGILTIISPIEDTPAWKAGLKSGDKIVSIDGNSTKGLSLAESAQMMRGDKGSKIILGIVREGFKDKKDFTIKRGTIKIKSVKFTDLGDGYGYIRLTSFIENSASDVKKVLKKISKKNKNVKGIILDLRRNPGGLLEQAIKISDFFLDKGTIVSTIGRDRENKKVVQATATNSMTDFPIVVLINEYSASASEIVAGALKDNKRALVMGKRSFGKGSVQSVVKMGDGSGLKMTVARYYTPSGISIQAKGIEPDVVIDEVDSEAFKKAIIKRKVMREADIDGHLTNEVKSKKKEKGGTIFNWWSKSNKKGKKKANTKESLLSDFQVLQAYNYLKAYKVMKGI
ncbi:MAG: S41 family peptidase [Bdellovibrionales bacterium]|nr:S41 family peptidase [Bdellovibrionales bacterium]